MTNDSLESAGNKLSHEIAVVGPALASDARLRCTQIFGMEDIVNADERAGNRLGGSLREPDGQTGKAMIRLVRQRVEAPVH